MRSKRYTTLTKDKVKSISERDIANFLFRNRVNFVYEDEAKWAQTDKLHKTYHPDFYLPDYDVYIEHWGLDRNNQVANWFAKKGQTRSDASGEY